MKPRVLPITALTAFFVFILVLFPIIAPALKLAEGGFFDLLRELCSIRRTGLLAESIALAGAVGVASAGWGLLLGVGCGPKRAKWLAALTLLAALIPPYLHALAWMTVIGKANDLLAGVVAVPSTGWLVSWWVELMAFAPFAVGFTLAGFAAISPAYLDAARVQAREGAVTNRILLPLVWPFAAAGGLAVFIFSLLDYSIPSLFQVNVYALELYADFSATGMIGRAFVLSLPLLAAALTAGTLAVRLAGSVGKTAVRSGNYPAVKLDGWWLGAHQLAWAAAGLEAAIPAVILILTAGSLDTVQDAFVGATDELKTSLLVATASGLVSVLVGGLLAKELRRPSRLRWAWWCVVIGALAAPAPLVGIGLITIWNSILPIGIYGTDLMPVLAGVARFAPWAALILALYRTGLDEELFDAARVARPESLATALRIKLPLLLPGVIAAGAVVFALTLGELGATLLVAPPGAATVTMRIYNYLHYGASDSVAGLALTILAAALVAEGVLFKAVARSW